MNDRRAWYQGRRRSSDRNPRPGHARPEPYAAVEENAEKVIRKRFDEPEITTLCELKWWDRTDIQLSEAMLIQP